MGIIEEIETNPPPIPKEELAEVKAFLAWLRSDHFTFLGYRSHELINVDGEDALRIVSGLGHPARRSGDQRRGELRRAAAGGARLRARAGSPDRDEGERALDRPSPRISRLRRRQALRRRRQRLRRASISRPVHGESLRGQACRHPGAAPEDRERHRACGPPGRRPRGQGARQHPRQLPARRALPDQRGRAASPRRWASCTSASGSGFACSSGATCSSASSCA